MQSKDQPGKPCAGNGKASDDEDEQTGCENMLQHIDEVVAQDGVAPEPVLDPKSGIEKRVVLLGRAEVRPDPPQTVQRLHGRRRDVSGVVPEQASVERGPIRD